MPKENKKDLEDVPKEVQKDLTFSFVSHMDEALEIALTKILKKSVTQALSTHAVLHAPSPYKAD